MSDEAEKPRVSSDPPRAMTPEEWERQRDPAKDGIFRYFDDWRSAILKCPSCGWRGRFMAGSVECFRSVFVSQCPKCTYSYSLAIVEYATIEECEIEGNLDKLPREERTEFQAWVDRHRRWEAGSLKSPSQLPELPGKKFALTWDFEEVGGEVYTVIRKKKLEVWRELASYGGGERFERIADILKARYGGRIVDLVPSSASESYLYDDDSVAGEIVDRARGRLDESQGNDPTRSAAQRG